MPLTPHPVTITVKDLDGSTARVGAKALIRNCTKGTTSDEETTIAGGIAEIDLANLPVNSRGDNAYDAGDVVLIIAYDKRIHAHIGARYVVTGASKAQTLNLNEMPYMVQTDGSRILSMLAANEDASVKCTVSLWAWHDCQLLARFEVPTSDTIPHYFGQRGIPAQSIIEIEDPDCTVTAAYK
jgi:hypothetical protein